MRVLILDRRPEVRSAVQLLLQQTFDGVQVEATGRVERALRLASRQRPDVILLDWELLGAEGERVARQLHQIHPSPALIALSGRPEVRCAALLAGVDAFVCKIDPPEHLVRYLAQYQPRMEGLIPGLPKRTAVGPTLDLPLHAWIREAASAKTS
jgi:two-component system response regulator DesR